MAPRGPHRGGQSGRRWSQIIGSSQHIIVQVCCSDGGNFPRCGSDSSGEASYCFAQHSVLTAMVRERGGSGQGRREWAAAEMGALWDVPARTIRKRQRSAVQLRLRRHGTDGPSCPLARHSGRLAPPSPFTGLSQPCSDPEWAKLHLRFPSTTTTTTPTPSPTLPALHAIAAHRPRALSHPSVARAADLPRPPLWLPAATRRVAFCVFAWHSGTSQE